MLFALVFVHCRRGMDEVPEVGACSIERSVGDVGGELEASLGEFATERSGSEAFVAIALVVLEVAIQPFHQGGVTLECVEGGVGGVANLRANIGL